MDNKSRIEENVFDSLDAMMAAYADEAVRQARSEHGLRLDYSDASVQMVEGILAAIDEGALAALAKGARTSAQADAKPDIEYATKLWGGYFGELLRRRYNGTWEMSIYPGGSLAVPTLEVKGSRLYPLMKVHRRLTLGPGEDVAAFYRMVVTRLGDQTRPN